MFSRKSETEVGGSENGKVIDRAKLSFKGMMTKATEFSKKVGEGATTMGKGMMSKLSETGEKLKDSKMMNMFKKEGSGYSDGFDIPENESEIPSNAVKKTGTKSSSTNPTPGKRVVKKVVKKTVVKKKEDDEMDLEDFLGMDTTSEPAPKESDDMDFFNDMTIPTPETNNQSNENVDNSADFDFMTSQEEEKPVAAVATSTKKPVKKVVKKVVKKTVVKKKEDSDLLSEDFLGMDTTSEPAPKESGDMDFFNDMTIPTPETNNQSNENVDNSADFDFMTSQEEEKPAPAAATSTKKPVKKVVKKVVKKTVVKKKENSDLLSEDFLGMDTTSEPAPKESNDMDFFNDMTIPTPETNNQSNENVDNSADFDFMTSQEEEKPAPAAPASDPFDFLSF